MYQGEKVTKKVYNKTKEKKSIYESLDKLLKARKKNVFINFKVKNKINRKGSDKYVGLSNLSIYYTWENLTQKQ